MHNSKLLQLLKLLNESELKRLKFFLKSPFFNTNPHLLKLYQVVRKDHPYFVSKSLAKEKVFQKIFPHSEYQHQKLLNLMSGFTVLLKQFLRIIQLEKSPDLEDRLFLTAISERPFAYDIFEKEVRKTITNLEKKPTHDSLYYRQKFWLGQLYYNHPATDKFQLSQKIYNRSMDQLDQSFILEKLSLSCEMKAREQSLSETHQVWLLPEIKEWIRENQEVHPVISAYFEMLTLLEKGNTETYGKLKGLLQTHFSTFTRSQQQQVLQVLINFTIRQGNQGEAFYLQENLELYQLGLTADLFFEHGILNAMQFISMVNIALRTGSVQWCKQFIDTYGERLDPRAQKDAVSLANALWLYQTQQAQSAVTILQEVDFLNVYYQVQSRVLLLKIFFEFFRLDQAYFELVSSQTEAFERYLRRNQQLAKNKKKGLLNFVLGIKRLIRLSMQAKVEEEEKTRLKVKVQQQRLFYNKSWFLKQI